MELAILVLTVLADIGVLCVGYLAASGKEYAKKKGENLATKEDIAGITRQIEAVRSEYAEKLQMLVHQNTLIRDAVQRRHELSMAALDKRLEAHQEAYAWWRRFAFLEDKDAHFEFFQECEKWWVEHCLYLSPEAEDAFWGAFHARYVLFSIHPNSAGAQQENLWKKVEGAGAVIRAVSQLPRLAEEVEKPLARPGAHAAEEIR